MSGAAGNTLSKFERLGGKGQIESLYRKGRSFSSGGFRVAWELRPAAIPPARAVITVPKRSFPRAVDRNRIKRLIREAYRQNKHSFYEYLLKSNKSCILQLIYVSKDMPLYGEVEGKIIVILQQLAQRAAGTGTTGNE